MTDSASGATTFLYDAEGNRLLRRDPGGTTLYLPHQEVRHSAGVKAASRLYRHNGNTIAVRTQAGLTWLVSDHQGTSSHAINAVSQAGAARRQLPFGGLRATSGS